MSENENISSVEFDQAVRPALKHIRAYFESDAPSDKQAKIARDGLGAIQKSTGRFNGETARAVAALRAAREIGGVTDAELRASIGPVLRGASQKAIAES